LRRNGLKITNLKCQNLRSIPASPRRNRPRKERKLLPPRSWRMKRKLRRPPHRM